MIASSERAFACVATDGYIFDDAVHENATLYVPQGSISKYQVMKGWSGFYNMSELENS